MQLSIIAPMYNEESSVETTFYEIKKYFDKTNIDWEFICVDDGSADGTLKRAVELGRKEPRLIVKSYTQNAGIGKALREGFKVARGRYIITIDFDLTYSVGQILGIYKKLTECPQIDAVFGSCYMKGGRVEGVDPYRLFVSWLGNVVLSTVFQGHVCTITCIFRGYKKEVIQDLELYSDKKDIHLEILAKLLSRHRKIIEIPAVLTVRDRGKSKFKFWRTSKSHLRFIFFYLLWKCHIIKDEDISYNRPHK